MRLCELKNTHKIVKKKKHIGRGPGSNRGKTSCRGHKGAKARSGYKRHAGKEGGALPLFQKLPGRGFSNARFQKSTYAINLNRLDQCFEDGDIINKCTLVEKGFPRSCMKKGFKVLAQGELTKKVVIEANDFSKNSVRKLEKNQIEFKRIHCMKGKAKV